MSMKMHDFVVSDAIVPQLEATDRDGAIRELVMALVAQKAVPATMAEELIKAIHDREKRGSTGFGKGVAVPHAMHTKVTKMVATIGVSHKGVDFNALDKGPVYSIVLLLSPKDNPTEHLQAMENIFSNLQKDNFRRFLRQANTAKDVVDLLHEIEGTHG